MVGSATASTGQTTGVSGVTNSVSGTGLLGWAFATTGFNYGVQGLSQSPSGVAVYASAAATTGSTIGVYGQTQSPSGISVYGYASASTGTTYGVVGATLSTSGYGVYYVGGLAGTGTKSAIVDTQDYGWRALYAVESPQNWFEDFGQATLNAGEAVVSIEPIFAQTVNLRIITCSDPRGDCGLYVRTDASSLRAREGDLRCHLRLSHHRPTARLRRPAPEARSRSRGRGRRGPAATVARSPTVHLPQGRPRSS
jgi:hypothetical protein